MCIRDRISNTPQYITVPTLAERTGNFTDVLGVLNSQISDSSVGTTRLPFQGLVNGVPTYNVIPQSEISSISWYLQNGCQPVGCAAVPGSLPPPTSLSTFNNYLAGLPLANQDYDTDVRLDYTLNSRNKFSMDGIGGTIGYGSDPFYSTQNQLPVPYANGQYPVSYTHLDVYKRQGMLLMYLIDSCLRATWSEDVVFSVSSSRIFTALVVGAGCALV